MNETMAKFGYPATLVKEYEHWVILVRPKQITLGTLVLVAKSEAGHLGMLWPEVWAEFSMVAHDAERITREAFGAEKFNYLALMMKDPNVHFHFIPRYREAVNFEGREFPDPYWPGPPEMTAMETGPEELAKIQEVLKSHL